MRASGRTAGQAIGGAIVVVLALLLGPPGRAETQAVTNANMLSGHGATTGGDPAAWADAKQQVAAFLARYLKPQR